METPEEIILWHELCQEEKKMEKKKLEVGEKYLSIRIVGHADVAAFKNPKKAENPKAPDFKADGVAVWVNSKKAEQPEVKTETI